MNPLNRLYNLFLRERLPKKISSYNGVPVRDHYLLDISKDDTKPDYEQALLDSLREQITRGQKVVIVGGGWGVSSVVAARLCRHEVVTFEGSRLSIERMRETLEVSAVDNVEINYAVVGRDIDTWEGETAERTIEPRQLPECDALVLDCEGAEQEILENLESTPQNIIVETHSMLDSPEQEVRKKLDKLDYSVVEQRVEDRDAGVTVLTAVQPVGESR